jgi:hypothetical protein
VQGKEPSSLLRRDDMPTLRSQGVFNHIPFNQEREKFKEINAQMNKAKDEIMEFSTGKFSQNYLALPSTKREELKQTKEALATYQDIKS